MMYHICLGRKALFNWYQADVPNRKESQQGALIILWVIRKPWSNTVV